MSDTNDIVVELPQFTLSLETSKLTLGEYIVILPGALYRVVPETKKY